MKYNSCPCDDTTYEYLSLEIDTAFLKFLYKTAVADHIPALSEKIRNDLDTEAKQSFYNETEKQTCSFIPLSESQIVKDNTPPNRWNQFELMQLTNDSIAKLFD